MKAFMSDVDGGPVWLDADQPDILGSCFGVRASEFAAEWAVNEARAILAETEPQASDGRDSDEAISALVSALTQFVQS